MHIVIVVAFSSHDVDKDGALEPVILCREQALHILKDMPVANQAHPNLVNINYRIKIGNPRLLRFVASFLG